MTQNVEAKLSEPQENALAFLKRDHGEYGVFTPLEGHLLTQEMDLEPRSGVIVADFKMHRFLIFNDGGFYPLPRSKE